MKYFLDTEFIEDGRTIDLLSIALVSEDDRTLYLQHADAEFKKAGDWVWRNVFPHLQHFSMTGDRSCNPQTDSMMSKKSRCYGEDCPWRNRWEIRDAIVEFCNIEKHGKPEFWGYYCDYDWVAFCQLFGSMIGLPKGFPMYCRDLKQVLDDNGNPNMPKLAGEHSALNDALWNKMIYGILLGPNRNMIRHGEIPQP